MLAQEIIIETPPDMLGRVVSVLALVIAVLTAWVTYWQGRVIRKIETREHEWEAEDRISAHVQVTSETERYLFMTPDGKKHREARYWLYLKNTGRAVARNVSWVADEGVEITAPITKLEELHPGENFDLGVGLALNIKPGWTFSMAWTDDRGRHETERRIGL